jgi:transglutaminase-like putative cysteine protease
MKAHDLTAVHMPGYGSKSWLKDGLFTLFLFFLFSEWVRPLTELAHLTDLYVLKPILVAIGSFLLIDYLGLRSLLGWTLKTAVSLALVAHLFHQASLLELAWWIEYKNIVIQDGRYIMQGAVDELSGETRTLMFLLGWALMISVVQSIVIDKRRGLWFVAGTLAYLIALQVWLGTDTHAATIRTFGLGLLFLAFLNLPRIETQFAAPTMRRGWPWTWIFVSLLLVAALSSAGVYMAKSDAGDQTEALEWPYGFSVPSLFNSRASLPPFQGSDAFDEAGARAQSGYGEDDSLLGGAVALDEGIVFVAKTDRLTYWRGESKSVYTGQGWTQPKSDLLRTSADSAFPSTLYDAAAQGWKTTITQEVLFTGRLAERPLFAGGEISEVDALLTGEGRHISDQSIVIDSVTGKYKLDAPEQRLTFYKIQVGIIAKNEMELAALLSEQGALDPAAVAAVYLQLPDELPDRVKQLAGQITAGIPGRYGQVKAIENHLRNGYAYSLDSPEYPEEGRDFVDHFLFSQKEGYCDYFSTAMVVMLRSVGIPARWVKGFAPGEAVETADAPNTPLSVTVRNKDAHSWVEVYFPQIGWMAFEPTPGFSGHEGMERDDAAAAGDAVPASSASLGSPDSELANDSSDRSYWSRTEEAAADLAHKSLRTVVNGWAEFGKFALMIMSHRSFWLVLLVGLAVIAAAGGTLWMLRDRIALGILVRRYRKARRTPDGIVRLLDRVWLLVFKRFGAIRTEQTLREYAATVPLRDEGRRRILLDFVRLYETIRYDRTPRPSISRQSIAEYWAKLFFKSN